jgi:dolichyl-phosphate-mannose-protein mannosyltransferase
VENSIAPFSIRRQQVNFVAALLLAGLALHFFRLDLPGAVVFDEVYFGRFADAYCCTGEYFFDVHPPHGKLLAALGLELGSYAGGQSFETIGTPLDAVDPVLLRLVPALAGSLIPVMVFILLIQLGASRWAAFLGGWAVLFDNALLLQTRVLALDGMMIFFILAAMSLALLAAHQARRAVQGWLSFGAGLCVGLALGTKFTGLTSALLVALILWFAPRRQVGLGRPALAIACAGLGAILVYLGGWVLHFALLDQPGPGDAWGAPSGDLLRDIIEVHRDMFQANYGLAATHPNASTWWGWPLMWRPLYYFAEGNRAIYFVGNPAVWWGSTVGLLCIVWTIFRRMSGQGCLAEQPVRLSWTRLLPLLGFVVSFLPYLLIPRVMFLYHYLPSLVFAICTVAVWLDPLGWTRPGRFSDQPRAGMLLIILIPVTFLVMSPLTYGFALPGDLLAAIVRLVH